MAVTMMRQDLTAPLNHIQEPWQASSICELTRNDQTEVLEFLAARPIHTVFMAGLIHDNGLLSPHNRGSFYGARNQLGGLEGVALIGHATIVEAHTDQSLIALARVARNCQNAHLIRGEQSTIKDFWGYYADASTQPRLVCSEHLFEITQTLAIEAEAADLRLATVDELDQVLAVNASMAFEEGGLSPLQRDPTGFRARANRRIDKGRVWIWKQDERLIFKADVVSETPEVTYIEGVYVHPEERRKGYGLRCIKDLTAKLLQQSRSICLTVNERNKAAIALYEKVGYQLHSQYETIYVR